MPIENKLSLSIDICLYTDHQLVTFNSKLYQYIAILRLMSELFKYD
jgi:hypothetical protein